MLHTCMLQAYVSKCFQVFHAHVFKCFIWMLHMFAMVFNFFQALSQVFQMLISSVSCVLFTTVASRCFKSRLNTAHGMHGEAADGASNF